MDALIAAAQEEGTLTTIALPHDWCNYGGVIEGFKAKYGLEVNELAPDAGSADELEAIRANQGSTGPQAPDVVDVGLAFGPEAKDEGLLQPYKVSTWDSIPDDAKDADGYWYGDYYGVLAFEVNADVVENVPSNGPTCSTPSTRDRSRWPVTHGSPIRRSSRSSPRRWPTVARSTMPRPVSTSSPS